MLKIPENSKWRPALWMIVFGAIALVSLLPLLGLVALVSVESIFGIEFRMRSFTGLAILAVGSISMAAVIGYVFLRTLLRPLQELNARAAEIDAGDLDAFRPMGPRGTREVDSLAQSLFDTSRKLIERNNYLNLFATHVSHELKTPLTAIQGASELLIENDEDMSNEQKSRFLNNIKTDAERMALLSSRLRELAHAELAGMEGSSLLKPVLEKCAVQHNLGLEFDRPDIEIPMIDANSEVVWQQLIQNAASHGAEVFQVHVSRADSGITLHIGDDGDKISEANRREIFTPFFTTRRDEGGTGMGLGIARAMVVSHGGALDVSEKPDFKFQIQFG